MTRRAGPLLSLVGLLAACAGDAAPPPASVGTPAPPYHARTLAGDSADLAAHRGHAILLNVWATWCDPCREEMPALEATHRELGALGLRVVGVSIDQRAEDAAVRRFVRRHGITFAVLRDPEDRVSRVFRLVGVPGSILIDRQGVIAHRWVGPFDPLSDENRARLERAVAGLDPGSSSSEPK